MNIFNLLNSARRLYIKYSSNPRPSSYPYITGDGFRKISDHIHDETQKINSSKVKHKEIVFVKSDMLKFFFQKEHLEIKNPYILISHNSDENIDEKYTKYVDNKIIHWFAQNCIVEHPKITAIPIGLDNLYWSYFGDTFFLKRMIAKKEIIKRKNKILFGFSVSTNPKERGEALNSLKNSKVSEEIKGFISFHKYINKLIKYKFVASPPGNGIDSPRQWQAMYLKTIPILKSNPNTKAFVKCSLPILEVDNWKEIEDKSEEDLVNMYNDIIKKTNNEALWMDYWITKIRNEQK